MGAAKQRAAQLAAWRGALSSDERKVFAAAKAAHERIVKPLGATGMCYRMTFFLTDYLAREHLIQVDPVVGYINDGTDDLMISHAWIEFGGKKTDISLTLVERPEAQMTGPLLILDREIARGESDYTYHRERTAAAVFQVQELMKDTRFREMLQGKEVEHERMTTFAKDLSLIRRYLDAAPDGLGYAQLVQMVGDTHS